MFEIGDIVRFKYTGMQAEIIQNFMDGSYKVWIESERDDSIAFEDDIVLAEAFEGIQESELTKKMKKEKPIKGLSTEEMFYSQKELKKHKYQGLRSSLPTSVKEEEEEEEEKFIVPKIKASAASDSGLYIAFLQTTPANYTIFLINDTATSFSFDFELLLQQKQQHSLSQSITPHSFFPIGEFEHKQLNDAPSINFSAPALHFETQLKIKYKKFARALQMTPLIGVLAHNFLLFKSSTSAAAKNRKSNLSSYTKQVHKEKTKTNIGKVYNPHDIERHAEFQPELDLHIENLIDSTSGLSPAEMLKTQLKTLGSYLEKAVELGVEEVFIIHGLGKGKLQYEVHKFLKQHSAVRQYKNTYNPKYGFGATQVHFKK